MCYHTSRSEARRLSAEFPIGDPFGGPAYGEKTDIGSVLGAVAGPIIGGLFGDDAADTQAAASNQASQQAQDAANAALQLQRDIYNQTRADQEPWRQAGVNALGQLGQGTGPGGNLLRPFGMSDFQQDPGYAFRLSEGMKGLERSAAARGGLLSGAMLKGISRYGQDFASNEYQNAYNRYGTNQSNQFNRLASMAGLGQTANNALGNAGQNMANQSGNLMMNNADNQGNALLAAANARGSFYQGLGNNLGRINYGQLYNSGGSSGSGGGGYGYLGSGGNAYGTDTGGYYAGDYGALF